MPRKEKAVFPPLIQLGLLIVVIVLLASLELRHSEHPPEG
jgi:hypothetical protein